MTEPTDNELDKLIRDANPTQGLRHDSRDLPVLSLRKLMRDAIAKWGTPPAVGWRYRMKGDVQWKYSERQDHFAHADEVQQITTPQPTQAQAGAVPLATYRAYALIDSMGWALDDQEKDDMLRLLRATEAAHGIKGGRHGAEN